MKRFLITAAATALGLAATASAASAAVVELGATTSPLVAPSCPAGVAPANCTIILTRSTALETLRDGVAYPHTVKQAGRIVAFTVGLSRLSSNRTTAHNDIHLLDSAYGGTTRDRHHRPAPGRRGAPAPLEGGRREPGLPRPALSRAGRAVPAHHQPAGAPGDVVALTTPTWAPVLSIDLNTKKFAYRQSRSTACGPPPAINAAQSPGQTATYGCNYPGHSGRVHGHRGDQPGLGQSHPRA